MYSQHVIRTYDIERKYELYWFRDAGMYSQHVIRTYDIERKYELHWFRDALILLCFNISTINRPNVKKISFRIFTFIFKIPVEFCNVFSLALHSA